MAVCDTGHVLVQIYDSGDCPNLVENILGRNILAQSVLVLDGEIFVEHHGAFVDVVKVP